MPPCLMQYLVHVNVGGMEMKGGAMMFFGASIANTFLRCGGMIIGTDFSDNRIAVRESSLLLNGYSLS